LYWRDFFTHVAYHFPGVFGNAFHERYNEIEWENDAGKFEAWCRGETGFPVVDAGMRELNTTGWMHNRVRMIVAGFLVKDLYVDWRWGEKYFAQRLVDYDPSVNNGNWQWAASTGCDAQPWFRIFNPWRQQEKFDPGCLYIKQWVPELEKYGPEIIHRLYRPDTRVKNYPEPIVDHKPASSAVKEIYASLARNK
jgi:deoxyribodipyrimidine photo-lyase